MEFILNIFRNLRHKNLVELIGIVMDDTNDVYMLTEYMANGNLVDFLRSRGRQLIDSSQLIYFARYESANH